MQNKNEIAALMQTSELDYNILRIIESEPKITQRELAQKLNLSLGKVNFCLKALQQKGFLKIQNFLNSKSKWAYLYVLTPHGLEAKASLTYSFLQRKMVEYDKLKEQILDLENELSLMKGKR